MNKLHTLLNKWMRELRMNRKKVSAQEFPQNDKEKERIRR